MKCEHKKTHFEGWPDGGAVEVCNDCGMSRHHWEQGESSWIMVKDIEQARKEIQKGIDEYLTEKITDENEI